MLSYFSTVNERTPLKQDAKQKEGTQQQTFWTPKSLLTIFLACAALAIMGVVVQRKRHDTQVPEVRPTLMRSEARMPKQESPIQSFLKCNPSVAPSESVSVSTGGAFVKSGMSPFTDPGCGAKEAALIRHAMQQINYNFQAVDPQNGMSPSSILQTLLTLSYQDLTRAIGDFNGMASKLGNLGALVKLFGWGMPIHNAELLASLGGTPAAASAVVAALTQCNIVRQCGSSPMYTSSVQLLPVPRTNLVVATDWEIQSSVETPVHSIDEHTLFLADNIPPVSGIASDSKAVLDMGSSSGVLGLIAGVKGASIVHMLQPNLRARRFAQFSIWLNSMQNKVIMAQGIPKNAVDAYDNSGEKFYLILADHVGTDDKKDRYIRDTIESSHTLLDENGALVLGFQGQNCAQFEQTWDPYFCGDTLNGDMSGNIACRKNDPAHKSQEGIMYGWKVPEQAVNSRKSCGQFGTRELPFKDGLESGSRACAYAKTDMYCTESQRLAAIKAQKQELVQKQELAIKAQLAAQLAAHPAKPKAKPAAHPAKANLLATHPAAKAQPPAKPKPKTPSEITQQLEKSIGAA